MPDEEMMFQPSIAAFAACHLISCLICPLSAQDAGPITRVADVRGLSKADAAKRPPVKVKGVVTWRGTKELVVQDPTAGIFVSRADRVVPGLWHGDDAVFTDMKPGMAVEIVGVADRGGFTPVILASDVKVLGFQDLPPPQQVGPASFFGGSMDSQRIEVRGVVQGYRLHQNGTTLLMNANPGRFKAYAIKGVIADPASLVDAEVRIVGVQLGGLNARGEAPVPRIEFNNLGDLVVEKPAPSSVFDAPTVVTGSIGQFRVAPLNAHRLQIEGVVTYAGAGNLLYIQSGNHGIRIETVGSAPFQVGDRVQASGFPDDSRPIAGMREAVVRKIATGVVDLPKNIEPSEIVRANASMANLGLTREYEDYDGKLVRFEAKLVEIIDSLPEQPRLVLNANSSTVFASLTSKELSALGRPANGSTLAVTGIAQLVFEGEAMASGYLIPNRIDLLLRDRHDIVILQRPSWWTRGRVIAMLAAVGLAFGGAMIWGWQLRRRVKIQATELAKEMRARRESAVEFQTTLRERNRLAANLHDTLLQTVGGIRYQLDACGASVTQGEGLTLPHLDVARRMVEHAALELRGSVWALRALPLHGRSLPDALKDLIAHVGMGHDAAIEVITEGEIPELPEFISGNLLLIVQESLTNALKHGHAEHIKVVVSAVHAVIHLAIHDDGSGFTRGSEPGPGQGHFGLAGMKERTDRLGGSLQIESSPRSGTTIRAKIPLRDFDDEIHSESDQM